MVAKANGYDLPSASLTTDPCRRALTPGRLGKQELLLAALTQQTSQGSDKNSVASSLNEDTLRAV